MGSDARILGTGKLVLAMQAALANGAMAPALEYEPGIGALIDSCVRK